MRPLLLALLLLPSLALAQPVSVPGTRASLVPPEGFVASQRFAGFESEALGASLMVIDVPEAPLAEMTAALTPEALAAQGIRGAEVREVPLGDGTATLVTGQQSAYGQTFDKWIVLTGDSLGVVMVNATLPTEASGEDREAVERAVLSLVVGVPSGDLFEGLPFTLALPEALPERRRIGASLLLAQTYGEEPPPGAPLYIAGLGAAPLDDDLDLAVRQRLRQTATLYAFTGIETQPLAVGGREGIELVARAQDVDTDADVHTVLVLVPYTETGYLIIQGIAGDEAWVERFRAITGSLTWNE